MVPVRESSGYEFSGMSPTLAFLEEKHGRHVHDALMGQMYRNAATSIPGVGLESEHAACAQEL